MWRVRAVDSETIPLAWADVRQIPMPAESGDLGEYDSGLIPIVIEETQLDLLGDFGENGKIGSSAVKLGAEWIALT